jgi:hypothetical protein
LAERSLVRPDAEESGAAEARAHTESKTEDGLQLVATFLSSEEANMVQGLLQSAGIPCSFQNEQAAAWSGIGELRLMVPASAHDRACQILMSEISEEELIAQAEAGATEAPHASADAFADEDSS